MYLLAIMSLVSVSVAVVSIGMLHRYAMELEKERLVELVQSQARLVRAAARFDVRFSNEDHPEGAAGAMLSQVRQAFSEGNGFGETGEFVLGRRSGTGVTILAQLRRDAGGAAPGAVLAQAAEPMQRALDGVSGVMIGLDYRSVETISAYEPLPELDAGLVAKIDLEEFRKPIIRASWISAIVAMTVIGLGALLLVQIESHAPKQVSEPRFLEPVSGISTKERFFYLILVMSVVAGVVIATPTLMIYQASMDLARANLSEMAMSQARLIGAVARFNAKFSETDHPDGAAGATLSQVRESLAEQPGIGKSGEFVLGALEDDYIVFLLKPRHFDHDIPPIRLNALDAEPMRQALRGNSGVITGLDYRAVEVLAAFEPVPELKIGLVAKIDLAELRAPFVLAAAIGGGFALVPILFGAFSLSRLGPWITSSSEVGPSSQVPRASSRGPAPQQIPLTLILFIAGLGLGIFALDAVTPLGVAGGVPFVAFILAGWWLPQRRQIIVLAIVATILVLGGYLLAPTGVIGWIVLINRVYAILAIWVTAVILGIAKVSETAREQQSAELRRLSLAVEHSPASVMITDAAGYTEYVNRSFTRLTGYDRADVIGRHFAILQSRETSDKVYENLWNTISLGREWRGEIRSRKKNGETFWEDISILPIFSQSGEIIHFVTLQEDITERKRAETALIESRKRLKTLIDGVPHGIAMHDGDFRLISWNRKFQDIFGFPDAIMKAGIHGSKHTRYLVEKGVFGSGESQQLIEERDAFLWSTTDSESEIEAPDGKWYALRITRPEDKRLLLTYTDISARKQAEERLKHLANHDPLTGLPSLRLLNDRLAGAMAVARRNDSRAALMFIDLDDFKVVNDSHGHETGDHLLKAVANRLASCVREVDTVARVGGDEFIIVLTDVSARAGIEKVARSVIHAVDQPFLVQGNVVKLGISVGIALYPDHGDNPEELLKRADKAMYDIKKKGKNDFVFA